jgi:8-oxo-dGTP diphosphatase
MPQKLNRSPRRAAGCVAYRYEGNTPFVLLIHDKYGRWTLPKGHLKPGESERAAALREVFEETAVQGELGPLVERIAYTVLSKNGAPREKTVAFFLLRATSGLPAPQPEEGIAAAEWFEAGAALQAIDYAQVRSVVARALEMLVEAPRVSPA